MKKKKTRPGNTVRATRFELLDAEGQPRATLQVDPPGIVSGTILDADDHPFLRVVVAKNPGGEVTFGLFDQHGESFLTFGFQPHGAPLIGLAHARGPRTAELTLSPLPPYLEIEDAGGRRPLCNPPGDRFGSPPPGERL
jgi:hypothetical protein